MIRELSETEISNIRSTAAQMTEKQRRQFYYRKAQELGRGGIRYIAKTFHVSGATLVKAGKDMPYLFVKSWLPNTKINGTGTRSADDSANHVCCAFPL